MSHESHLRRHGRRAAVPIAAPYPSPEPVQTYVSIVYVTAPATFTGSTYSLSTQGQTEDATTEASSTSTSSTTATESKSSATTTSADTDAASPIDTDTSSQASSQTASTSTAQTTKLASTANVSSNVPLSTASSATSTHKTTSTTATAVNASENTSSASTTSDSATSSSSGGMSTAGKAGLAIGILLLVGVAFALILLFIKKRKEKARTGQVDDEKSGGYVAGAQRAPSTRSVRTLSTAPQVSLRPVTQFRPDLNAQACPDAAGSVMANMTPNANAGAAWRPPAGQGQNEKENPFGHHAEPIDPVNANGPTVVENMSSAGDIIPTAAAAAATLAPSVPLKRGASKRGNGPQELDFTKNTKNGGPFMGEVSPTGTEFSMTSEPATPAQTNGSMAIAAAGGPPNSTVHRVQLDFKPSMEDELDLRAGQLVRMLHEYDDGWALCIRLDRSRQGVVPRTCLSTRPVKPRPQQNGPRIQVPPGMRVPQQQGRPASPGMNQGHSASPGMKQSPRQLNVNQGPPRSNSPNTNLPATPTGPHYKPQRQNASPGASPNRGPPRALQDSPMALAGNQAMTLNGSPKFNQPMGTPTFGPGDVRAPQSPSPSADRPVTPNDQGFNFEQPQSPPIQPQVTAESPPQSPPRTGVVERKPVPGQAL